jgi:hypothetical protein
MKYESFEDFLMTKYVLLHDGYEDNMMGSYCDWLDTLDCVKLIHFANKWMKEEMEGKHESQEKN